MKCPDCGGPVESTTYVDYCAREGCDWGYGYPSLASDNSFRNEER